MQTIREMLDQRAKSAQQESAEFIKILDREINALIASLGDGVAVNKQNSQILKDYLRTHPMDDAPKEWTEILNNSDALININRGLLIGAQNAKTKVKKMLDVRIQHTEKALRGFMACCLFNGITPNQVQSDIFASDKTDWQGLLKDVIFPHGASSLANLERLIERAGEINNAGATAGEKAIKQFVNHVIIPNRSYFDYVLGMKITPEKWRTEMMRGVFSTSEVLGEMKRRKLVDTLSQAHKKIVADKTLPHIDKLTQMQALTDGALKETNAEFAEYSAALEALEKKLVELHALKDTTQVDLRGKQENNKAVARQMEDLGYKFLGKIPVLLASALMTPLGAGLPGLILAGKSLYDIGYTFYSARRLTAREEDLSELQLLLADVKESSERLERSTDFKKVFLEKAGHQHLEDLMLMKATLELGLHQSEALNNLCKSSAVGSIDAWLDHYKASRVGMALHRHCTGTINSDDLSVILAESNAITADKADIYDAVLKQYTETVLKPQIDSHYAWASKTEYLRQANKDMLGHYVFADDINLEKQRSVRRLLSKTSGASVIGKDDVSQMFNFWLHRHGDRYLRKPDANSGESFIEKQVPDIDWEHTKHVDRIKGAPKVPTAGDIFVSICSAEYFAAQRGEMSIERLQTNTSAKPMIAAVLNEFVRTMSFSGINEYRKAIGPELDNVIAQTFIDYFATLGGLHAQDTQLIKMRSQALDLPPDHSARGFDRYIDAAGIDAIKHFDVFMALYKKNIEKQLECVTDDRRALLESQIEDLRSVPTPLNIPIVKPNSREARLRAHLESHMGENMTVFHR